MNGDILKYDMIFLFSWIFSGYPNFFSVFSEFSSNLLFHNYFHNFFRHMIMIFSEFFRFPFFRFPDFFLIFYNNSPPLIIPAPLKFQKKVSSTSNSSRIGNYTKLYWYTMQVILVFFRPTVKKFTKNCLGPFQMRGKYSKIEKMPQLCNFCGSTRLLVVEVD